MNNFLEEILNCLEGILIILLSFISMKIVSNYDFLIENNFGWLSIGMFFLGFAITIKNIASSYCLFIHHIQQKDFR